jgi:hypothetical protein
MIGFTGKYKKRIEELEDNISGLSGLSTINSHLRLEITRLAAENASLKINIQKQDEIISTWKQRSFENQTTIDIANTQVKLLKAELLRFLNTKKDKKPIHQNLQKYYDRGKIDKQKREIEGLVEKALIGNSMSVSEAVKIMTKKKNKKK